MMKRLGLVGWAYVLALVPLGLGSGVFFYWFFQRRWNAVDVDIYGPAAVSILLYFGLGFAAAIFCLVGLIKEPKRWYRVVGPLAIVAATWFVVEFYETCFYSDDHAYLRVDVRGTDVTHVLIWSEHFASGMLKDPRHEVLVFVFDPVYTYDWGGTGSGGDLFVVDSVFIEIHERGNVRTYVLPELLKGDCWSLSEEELYSLPKARNRDEVYGVTEGF